VLRLGAEHQIGDEYSGPVLSGCSSFGKQDDCAVPRAIQLGASPVVSLELCWSCGIVSWLIDISIRRSITKAESVPLG
jgi:hypothetical protein